MIDFKDLIIGSDHRSFQPWHIAQLFRFCSWQLTARLPINLTCMPLSCAMARSPERNHELESDLRGVYYQIRNLG
jgi:hypothetical protein